MNRIELTDILKSHSAWLYGEGGNRADLSNTNLSGIDLSFANLSSANLSDANLSSANLTGATLTGANLSFVNLYSTNLNSANLSSANLTGATLTGANLSKVNLYKANLNSANLSFANLTGASLRFANLTGAELPNANLTDACLTGTCLDDELLILARRFAKECPPLSTGGRIVYRTARSQNVGTTKYEPGHTYVAPHLSYSVEDACHPGIYAASLKWMQEQCPRERLVRCYVRDGDWVISAKGAIRAKRLRVLGYVEGVRK